MRGGRRSGRKLISRGVKGIIRTTSSISTKKKQPSARVIAGVVFSQEGRERG